jgi:hypothetical protein
MTKDADAFSDDKTAKRRDEIVRRMIVIGGPMLDVQFDGITPAGRELLLERPDHLLHAPYAVERAAMLPAFEAQAHIGAADELGEA